MKWHFIRLKKFPEFFEVVEISYSEEETVKIVRHHFKDIDNEKVEFYIKKYGNKPRYIMDALENEGVNPNLENPEPVKTRGKPGK